jgi:hypothetical protein
MLKWIVIVGCAAASVARTDGAPYCAYEVRVNKPSGLPFAKTPVGIVDKGTQIGTETTDANGVARLCDAPVHKIDIAVGAVGQGLTIVRAVKPTWPKTRVIVVIRDDSAWDEFVFPDACQILLRIRDERGLPISGARFEGRSSGVLASMNTSDDLGRLFRKLKSGGSLNGSIAGRGYISAPVAARCIKGDEDDIELRFVLKHQ